MSMSKKDFIALADVIRGANTGNPVSIHTHAEDGNKLPIFTPTAIAELASFCASQNPRFNRERWLAYIAGECGPNRGAVKGGPSNPWKDAPCAVAMGCLCAGHARNPKRKTCDTSEK